MYVYIILCHTTTTTSPPPPHRLHHITTTTTSPPSHHHHHTTSPPSHYHHHHITTTTPLHHHHQALSRAPRSTSRPPPPPTTCQACWRACSMGSRSRLEPQQAGANTHPYTPSPSLPCLVGVSNFLIIFVFYLILFFQSINSYHSTPQLFVLEFFKLNKFVFFFYNNNNNSSHNFYFYSFCSSYYFYYRCPRDGFKASCSQAGVLSGSQLE